MLSNSVLFPDVLDAFFGNNKPAYYRGSNEPAINVIENNKEYRVEMAAPGMKKEDFTIKLDNDNNLVINMEKKQESSNCNQCDSEEKKETSPAEKEQYLRHEFSYTKFQQTYSLPEDVNLDGISAQMSDGILCIDLPKKEPETPKNYARVIDVA